MITNWYGMKMNKIQHRMNRSLLLQLVLVVMMAAACSNEDAPQLSEQEESNLVLLGADAYGTASTRASSTPLPNGGRFACKMYYKAGVNSDIYDAHTLAWLQVDDQSNGNSLYRQASFGEPDEDNKDTYGFDKSSSIFYWQNRKEHTFIALADFNKLDSDQGSTEGSILNDKAMEQEYSVNEETSEPVQPYIAFKLIGNTRAEYSEQPDPIRAVTAMVPKGYTPEANRVKLVFKHCFAQVQVNLAPSPDGSASDLTAENIVSVELMGVTAEGRVTPWIKPDGTYEQPSYKEVLATDFTTEEWEATAHYGTNLKMFPLETAVTGYLKSYQAIAFGMLRAIRITWKEPVGEGGFITHEAIRAVEIQYQKLKSGTRHIFNIQIRRGMLAVITADIVPWELDDTEYTTDGSVTTTTSNGE